MRYVIDEGRVFCTFRHTDLIEDYTDARLLEAQTKAISSSYGTESSVAYLAEIAWLMLLMPNLDEVSILQRWASEPIMKTLDTAAGTEIKTCTGEQTYRRFFPNVHTSKQRQMEIANTFVWSFCSGMKKVPIADANARGVVPHGVRFTDDSSGVCFVEFADMRVLREAGFEPDDHLRRTGLTVSVCFRGLTRPVVDHPSLEHLHACD